jgi:hypothetical protein
MTRKKLFSKEYPFLLLWILIFETAVIAKKGVDTQDAILYNRFIQAVYRVYDI